MRSFTRNVKGLEHYHICMNNKVSNLYWGTQEENVKQCIHGNFYFVKPKRKKT